MGFAEFKGLVFLDKILILGTVAVEHLKKVKSYWTVAVMVLVVML